MKPSCSTITDHEPNPPPRSRRLPGLDGHWRGSGTPLAVGLREHPEAIGERSPDASHVGFRDRRRPLEELRSRLPYGPSAENSSADGGVVAAEILRREGNHGYDAASNFVCDLLEAGIVDPTDVVCVALENAVRVAGALLLTEATLVDVADTVASQKADAIPAL